jgi:GH18 family chitinase
MTWRPTDASARRRLGPVVAGAVTALVAPLGAVALAPAALAPAAAATGLPRPIVSGWIPYWDVADGTAAVVANKDLVRDVSPFWYSAQWTGSASTVVEQGTASTNDAARTDLKAAGILVLPAVTDGMPAKRMAAVMADTGQRAAFVNQLVSLVTTNGYDGLDLDLEKFAFSDGRTTWPTTRPAWVAFVAQLSAALRSKGKLLSVTTPPIYNANRDSTSGYWVYDWAGIAPYVDRLRIMTYDYSVSGGNIAPFPWVEKVVAFAVTQVPSGKIQVGVPAYGRNAVVKTRNSAGALVNKVVGTCPTNVPSNYLGVLSFTAASAVAGTAFPLTANSSATVSRTAAVRTWDVTNKEWRFTYQVTYRGTLSGGTTPTTCTVYRGGWYDESKSAAARASLVGKYRLAGIAQWTLGGQDDAQWPLLRSYAETIAPSTTTVTLTVAASTTYGTGARVTAKVAADGVAVPGAGAVLFVRRTGTTTWTRVASATTSSTGVVTVTTPAVTAGLDVLVQTAATWDRTRGSASASTRVRSRVVVTPSATVAPAGASVRVKVQVDPRIKGQVVSRQELRSGSWVTVATTYANVYGRAYFSVLAPAKGKVRVYRVQARGIGAVVGTSSGSYRLTGS